MMHVLDYDRALGELLELDDTIRATLARESHFAFFKEQKWNRLNLVDLEEIGQAENTLIVVTADHGHGFVS